MGKIDDFCTALQKLSDRCIPYYGEGVNGLGCSAYVVEALQDAGIIKPTETFWAGQGQRGVLTDTTRFQHLKFDPSTIRRGDILYAHWIHVLVWDGIGGVWEGSPKRTHGVCDNGVTGVGHRTGHGYRNCGNGSYTWSDVYRIIEPTATIPEEPTQTTPQPQPTPAQPTGGKKMDTRYNAKLLGQYLPVIKQGVRGDTVKGLQIVLRYYGFYAMALDGICGPGTVEGIKKLQSCLGVTVDGICGPQTWRAMIA